MRLLIGEQLAGGEEDSAGGNVKNYYETKICRGIHIKSSGLCDLATFEVGRSFEVSLSRCFGKS